MTFFSKIHRFLRLKISLRSGTDVEGTISEISKNVVLRGVNVWMLVCSAILASIGLDVSSTAVIIGAMLISPLMSPILGVGLGVAIQDRKLLYAAMKNLLLATFLSIATSFIYFFISPLGEITPEISARITPTILDVGVAFFGGVAGIAAGSRRDKTNAIPGVAIATALMPPICVAGFGLAKMNGTVFLGAFYLYFINAVFIALATYLISIWLKFPKREQIDEEQKATVRRFIIGFVVLMMIPSALIFYNVLSELRFNRNVKNFVTTEVRRDDRQPVQWEVSEKDSPRTLKIYTVGRAVNFDEKRELQQKLLEYGLGDLKLDLVQLNVSPDEFERLATDVESNLADKVKLLQSVEEQRKKEIEDLQNELSQIRENSAPEKVFLIDMKRLFPEIVSINWQPPPTTDNANTASNQDKTLLIEYKNDVTDAEKRTINAKILRLAAARLREDRFRIVEKQTAPPQNEQGGASNANTGQ